MSAVITLTTDFGLSDAYVAAMKGVILGINPRARLVDVSHAVPPQDIGEAAFILGSAWRYFPPGTLHLAVVDPGVGSERRAIILKTPSACFVGPDNGVFSYVTEEYSAGPGSPVGSTPGLRSLPPGLEAVAITRTEFWRSPVSLTFHGRDVFAPVAAHLSLGHPIEEFGERVESLVMLPSPRAERRADGSLVGRVLHIDGFGNLVTSIACRDLPPARTGVAVMIAGREIRGLVRTYADAEGLLALEGSSGYLEVSLRDGSARDLLGAGVGDQVIVRPIAPRGQ